MVPARAATGLGGKIPISFRLQETPVNVKEAVRAAMDHAQLVFEGETIRLEEVGFEDATAEWFVTVGLQRKEPGSLLDGLHGKPHTRMHYKTLRIDDKSGTIKSVRNHDTMPVSPA